MFGEERLRLLDLGMAPASRRPLKRGSRLSTLRRSLLGQLPGPAPGSARQSERSERFVRTKSKTVPGLRHSSSAFRILLQLSALASLSGVSIPSTATVHVTSQYPRT